VAGASGYQIQLSTFANFSNAQLVRVTTTAYTPPGPLLFATYYWQVQAFDAAGNFGPWSAVRTVKIVSPATAVPILNRFTTTTPTLTWTPVSWAQGYEIAIDDSTAFTSPLMYGRNTIGAGSTSHLLESPLPNGIYYWRVRAKSGATTWGAWSTVGTFLIDAP
jgi:hypothetical protein